MADQIRDHLWKAAILAIGAGVPDHEFLRMAEDAYRDALTGRQQGFAADVAEHYGRRAAAERSLAEFSGAYNPVPQIPLNDMERIEATYRKRF